MKAACTRCTEGGLAALKQLWHDQSATTSLEYALMLALVGLSAVAGYRSIGDTVAHGVTSGNEGVESVGAATRGDAAGSVAGSGSAAGAGVGAPGGATPGSPAAGAAAPGSG